MFNKHYSILAIIFATIILCSFTSTIDATYLTFQVDSRKSRCFYEEVNAGSVFDMYFEVTRGGLLDIKFQLTDPNRNVVLERVSFFNKPNEDSNMKEGTIAYTAKTTGVYKFCFDNTSSRWTSKVVSFEIRSQRANKQEAIKLEHLGPMVDNVISLSNDLDELEQKSRHNKIREHQHYTAIRVLKSRVQWISIISSIIITALTWLSISNIQKWFSTNDMRGGRAGYVV
eukprot:UN01516